MTNDIFHRIPTREPDAQHDLKEALDAEIKAIDEEIRALQERHEKLHQWSNSLSHPQRGP